SKRNPKNPQNLKDYVHSVNNTKNKKANGPLKKTNKNGNQNVSEGKSGEKSGKKDWERNMESDNDKEDRVEIEEVNGNDRFDGDLCGDQFPPIIDQVVNNEKDGIQGCLDDSEYNGKGEDDDIKLKDVSEGSTSKPVGKKVMDIVGTWVVVGI
ncbi:hypothetical protein Tco_1424348, partial [Tanacetum coccineum]